MQRTLARSISCDGVGLHSGRRVAVTLLPAPIGAGISFHRTDIGIGVPARFDRVCNTTLSTVLGRAGDPEPVAGTVEHLMAAVSANRIDNLRIELDGPEVPILDGSAAAWMLLLDCAGRSVQHAPRRLLRVLRPVRVERGNGWAELAPGGSGAGLSIELGIDFDSGAVGTQHITVGGSEHGFRDRLAVARTFTFRHEIEALHAAGLARGGSLDNAVVVDGPVILNPGGLRGPDEFVRHKALDVVGDLALAGHPIVGRFTGCRTGHRLNNDLLHALFADRRAWTLSAPAVIPETRRRAA